MDSVRGKLVVDTSVSIDDAKKKLTELQAYLDKLTVPKGLQDKFSDLAKPMLKELDKIQDRLSRGIETRGDLGNFDKSQRTLTSLYEVLDGVIKKIEEVGPALYENLSAPEIENLKTQIEGVRTSLTSIGAATPQLETLQKKFGQTSNYSDALKNSVEDFVSALSGGDMTAAQEALQKLGSYAARYQGATTGNKKGWVDAYQEATVAAQAYQNNIESLERQIESLQVDLEQQQKTLQEEAARGFEQAADAARDSGSAMLENGAAVRESEMALQGITAQVDSFLSRATSIATVSGAFLLLKKAVRSAYEDVKELDAAMNSIAVVTDFTTQELWKQVDVYAELAQKMGVSLVGVYDVQKLYYQQGRDAADVAILTAETLKFARIAEMDYAEATDAMTVAINAFKLEASDASRVVDVYSQLAARAAVDQNELANAMSKVASMAASVGMSLETTSAFLAQIIESTRESAETSGTALKTVLARFGEVKELIDTGKTEGTTDEGEAIDVNKIDTALKAIGVRLTDEQGQMRALDQVLIETAQKWDSLDSMTQRYLATMAAGSRQQSRFIALMSDSERLVSLLGEAYNSAGAGEKQYEKTQESLETKLNNLHTAWTEFTTSIADSNLIKGAVDLLTQILNTANAITDAFGSLSGAVKLAIGSFALFKVGQKGIGALKNQAVNVLSALQGNVSPEDAVGNTAKFAAKGKEAAEAFKAGFASVKDAVKFNPVGDKKLWREAYAEGYEIGKKKIEGQIEAEQQWQKVASTQQEVEWSKETVRAYQQGMEEGAAEEGAKNATKRTIMAAQDQYENSHGLARVVYAYKLGFAKGESEGRGFTAGLAAGTKELGSLIAKTAKQAWGAISAFFGTAAGLLGWVGIGVAIGTAVAKLVQYNSAEERAARNAEKIQKVIDEINDQLSEINQEISDLESKENLTAAEKTRLNYLKKQTEELEKQKKIESENLARNNLDVRGKNKITTRREYNEDTGDFGVVSYSSKVESGEDRAAYYRQQGADAEKALANLDVNAADYEDKYQRLKFILEESNDEIQKDFDLLYENASYLSDEEMASFFRNAEYLGTSLEALAQAAPDTYNEIGNLKDSGQLSAQAIEELAKQNSTLAIYLAETKDGAEGLVKALNKATTATKEFNKVQNYKDAAEEVKTMKKSINAVGDAIKSIYENGYADIDKISTIANDEAFADLDSFENFLDIISSAGTNDIPQVTDAWETLLDEYMSSDGVLTGLNENTKALYLNMLKNSGVINAQEVVDNRLSLAQAQVAANSQDAANAFNGQRLASIQVKEGLEELAAQYGTTSEAVAYFVVKQKIANASALNTAAGRKELKLLMESLGIAAEAIEKYNKYIVEGNRQNSLASTYRLKENAAIASGNTALAESYAALAQSAENVAKSQFHWAQKGIESELDKISTKVTVGAQVDPTQFKSSTKSSSDTEKEIQKLSELYNAKKRIAEIEEELADLEREREGLVDYDSILKNEEEYIRLLKEKKKATQQIINQNEQLRVEKLQQADKAWAKYYNIDPNSHELKLTQAYYKAIVNPKASKTVAEMLNNFKDWVEEYDDIVELSRDEENVLAETNNLLKERWELYRDNYIDIINELASFYEDAQQDIIDAQKDAYDEMKKLDDNYLEELKKNIEARRNARDRENSIQDITDKQKRLNMLMRDTSGRNAGEIADLQKEIQDAQQDLIDEDTDRLIEALEAANEEQQDRWDEQIDLMEKQLEADKKNGEFIRMAEEEFAKGPQHVRDLFEEFYSASGQYSGAEILKKMDELVANLGTAFKYFNGENPMEGTLGTSDTSTPGISGAPANKGGGASGGKGGTGGSNGTGKAYNAAVSRYGAAPTGKPNLKQGSSGNSVKWLQYFLNQAIGAGLNIDGKFGSKTYAALRQFQTKANLKLKDGIVGPETAAAFKRYATGGYVDYTGPAWVDGSPTKPEAILSAKDTQNFIQLKQLIATMVDRIGMNNSAFDLQSATGNTCTIYVNVDQLASDYDVDDMVNRVKQEIMNSTSYRNINLINRRR